MKEKNANILCLIATLLVAGVLEVLRTTLRVLPLESLSPNAMYVLGVVITLLLLADVFVSMRMTKLSRVVRMGLLSAGAIVNLLYYYLFSGDNTLYFFPMYAVAYFILLIKTGK